MDEYVLQGGNQASQMQARQPLTVADISQQPQQNIAVPIEPLAQNDAEEGFTPYENQPSNIVVSDEGFTPYEPALGSTDALQQAVDQAPLVGRNTFRPRSLLVEQADLMLGRESAKKFQAFEASGGNPEPSIEFNTQEQKLLNEYRFNQGRRVASMAAGTAAGVGLSLLPGGQTIGGEILGGVASGLLQQTIAPEPYDIQEAASQGVPFLGSLSKRGLGGFRNPLPFLTTAETGVKQQSSKLKQILKEAYSGSLTGAAQGFASTLGDEKGKVEEIIKQAAFSGLLTPTLSTGARSIGALSRSGPNIFRFAGEFQRPYTQQFLTERTDSIIRELGPGGGIDPAMATQLAETLYSPKLSGTRPEDIKAWNENIQTFLQDSIRKGSASGLRGDDITIQIVSELNRITERKDIDPDLISRIVLNADQMIKDAKKKVDFDFADKNSELLGAARRAEGELQLESDALLGEIADLQKQKNDLKASDDIAKNQIDNEIFNIQNKINDIENGFDPKFDYGKPVTQFETGKTFNEKANVLLKEFKDKQNLGYGNITPQLEAISVQVPKIDKFGIPVKDKNGNQILDNFTLEDLKQQRTKILYKIDFNKPVNKGTYDEFQELERVEKIMEAALNTNPTLKTALEFQNKSYREGITRFKGTLIGSLLRETGEGGGRPEAVMSLLGSDGGTALEVMKKVAGSEWDTEFKPLLYDFVYNKLRTESQTPVEFLSLLTQAKAGKGKGLSGEVANEFFPQLSEVQDVANRYKSFINDKSALINKKNDLIVAYKESEVKLNTGEKDAEKLLKKNKKNLESAEIEIQRLDQKYPNLGTKFEKDTNANAKEIVGALTELQTSVNGKSLIKLDDEKIKLILSNPDSRRLAKDLQLYVQQAAKEGTEFQKIVKDAVETGRFSAKMPQPEDVVSFLTTDYGTKQRYVVEKFIDVMRSERPDLVGDVQNFIIGNLMKESLNTEKKQVDIKKMRQLISDQYNPLIVSAFGKSGVDQMNKIADQLSVVIEKDSLVKRKLIPALTSAVASTLGSNMYGRMALANLSAYTGVAAVGRVLKNPEYLATVSKPIDLVEKIQMDTFNRRWPKILSLEADRLKMRNDERKDAERPQIPPASVRRF